ncbi:hypothetical protein LLEC1_02672 [Akanthomyces lecanii]|uniref:Uncharacterized protein n=1 Tax=Cordyceps confragosa TaxID=2714763 RepID=A0A179I573_CORDF|nr:hypothetical protein LLEC1_02672 [Akanthomyces lecanii]
MPGQFVWINGMPGVGKLTVARALHALLPGSHLVDNHSLIDQVAESACGDQAAQLARVVIFTDFFTAGTIGTEWSRAHQTAAAKAGRPFLPVYLTCEREENLRRVARPERGEKGSSKLTDVELVRKFMEDSKIYKFPDLGVDIDTTAREPEKTAQLILEAMEAQLRET